MLLRARECLVESLTFIHLELRLDFSSELLLEYSAIHVQDAISCKNEAYFKFTILPDICTRPSKI